MLKIDPEIQSGQILCKVFVLFFGRSEAMKAEDCSILMDWAIGSYTDLNSFDELFWRRKFSWLPSKNKVADENLHFQRHIVKLQCLVLELLFINIQAAS